MTKEWTYIQCKFSTFYFFICLDHKMFGMYFDQGMFWILRVIDQVYVVNMELRVNYIYDQEKCIIYFILVLSF